MTIENVTRATSLFTGNGMSTAYPFYFKAFGAGSVVFTVYPSGGAGVEKTRGLDFEVALNSDQDNYPGGYITYPLTGSPLPVGDTARVSSRLSLEQAAAMPSGGRFPSAVVEAALDRLAAIDMEQALALEGTVRLPPGETAPPLPARLARAGRYGGYDAEGNPALLLAPAGTAGSVISDLANPTYGDAMIAVQLPGGVTRTLDTRIKDRKYLTDFGIVADGTDQTAAIVAWAATAAPGRYYVPYNTRFTVRSVLAALPVGVTLEDNSAVNGYYAAGETSRVHHILSGDTDTSDTHIGASNRHHVVFSGNNYGGPTTSGQERKYTFAAWLVGDHANGAADKRGYRMAALMQFTNITGSTYWARVMRRQAPWAAIADEYEFWAAGETITAAGKYRTTGEGVYVSQNAAVCGATMPVHTSGTAYDGGGTSGVNWLYVCSGDATVDSMDEYGRFLIGAGGSGPTFRHKVSADDPSGGSYLGELHATGINKAVVWKAFPTHATTGVAVAMPYFQWQDGYGMMIMKPDGSGELSSVTANGWRFGLKGNNGGAPTVVSAATVAFTTPVVFLSGTTPIDNISVPALFDGVGGEVLVIPLAACVMTTAGNIARAKTGTANLPFVIAYQASTNKWYPA